MKKIIPTMAIKIFITVMTILEIINFPIILYDFFKNCKKASFIDGKIGLSIAKEYARIHSSK